MTEEEIDKVICDWSFRSGHQFTQDELDSLVEDIVEFLGAEGCVIVGRH